MTQRSLERFVGKAKKSWGPLSSGAVAVYKSLLEELARDRETATWAGELLRASPAGLELYRDPEHGFILTAYQEARGQYRAPHDHGSGWVVYAVLEGSMEMATYASIVDQKGRLRLVRREGYRMEPGECKVFLPSDIHDTLCVSPTVTVIRFTSCDLKEEDREGRMIRFIDPKVIEVQS